MSVVSVAPDVSMYYFVLILILMLVVLVAVWQFILSHVSDGGGGGP